MGDNRDCAVRALQHAGGYEYKEAQAIMSYFGRRLGRGTPWATIHKAFDQTLRVKTRTRYVGKTVYKALLGLPKIGTYIISVRGHIFTYKDGEVKDWMQSSSRMKIDQLWLVKGKKRTRAIDKIIDEGILQVEDPKRRKNRKRYRIGVPIAYPLSEVGSYKIGSYLAYSKEEARSYAKRRGGYLCEDKWRKT